MSENLGDAVRQALSGAVGDRVRQAAAMSGAPYVPHPPHGPDRECPDPESFSGLLPIAMDGARTLAVLKVLEKHGHCDGVFWRTDGAYAPITFLLLCNDVFAWGCADAEPLAPEQVDDFDRACLDAEAAEVHGGCWGPELFCSRVRKMRPQGPYMKGVPAALRPLFEAAGPERCGP